jgi:hypothetical protein
MTVTLNLKPEVEAGLVDQAREADMTLEGYLESLIERELPDVSVEAEQSVAAEESEESGMVWEDGLLVYRTGRPLPAYIIDNAVKRSREERARHLLVGRRS